jgi:phenylalanyl-tRNA synthetase beta chain
LPYEKLKEALKGLPKEVRRFYAIDEYSDENLGDKKSVTVRFAIQADDRTLQEEEIAKILETIIEKAKRVGAQLR